MPDIKVSEYKLQAFFIKFIKYVFHCLTLHYLFLISQSYKESCSLPYDTIKQAEIKEVLVKYALSSAIPDCSSYGPY